MILWNNAQRAQGVVLEQMRNQRSSDMPHMPHKCQSQSIPFYADSNRYIIEGSLEVKLPTIWTDEKQRWEESEKRREEKKKEDQKRESLRRKKIQMREKVGKLRNTVFFQWFVGSEGRKVAEAVGAEPAGQMRDEQLHAVVARNTLPSQNVQNTPTSDHFWKLRCRKSARRCGAKQLHYTNCTTPQLQLYYTTTYYSYNYSCTTPHYIQQLWVRWPTRWSLQPVEPLQKTQLQPPFRPSMGSLCHPWLTTTNLSYRIPFFCKLPPPPCAVLLVYRYWKKSIRIKRFSFSRAAGAVLEQPRNYLSARHASQVFLSHHYLS